MLAALNASTQEICTVQTLPSITAEIVCELLFLVAGASPGMPITVVFDQARAQRCAWGQRVAEQLHIALVDLPTYSPNLNLSERCWKFVKNQCLDSKYYPDSASFQQAILTCIEQAPTTPQAERKRLLTLRFQTFQEVPVLGEQQMVSQTPMKKVLSKAA